ncbi:MAG: glycosyltransferase family 4 protein [Lachnospiraceae bacterium]|nr:glycosyltransferase family 4 protein [Lachnospiraceae bacterium]
MKILYITLSDIRLNEQGIYPDLINALKASGHDITVCIADSPENIEKTVLREEYGVRFLRVLVGENFNVGLIKKGINTLKMEPVLKASVKKYLKDESFDLILYATPPVSFAGVVRYCKRYFKAKTFLMLKDIFPQNAVDIGLFGKSSLIHRYFKAQEKKLYEYSDVIGCMSFGNLEYIQGHYPFVPKEKLMVFPNTVKINGEEDLKGPETSKDPSKVRFVFGGNLGRPQAIDFLLDAMADERLAGREDIEFLIIGKGSEKEKVRKASEKLPGLTFIEYLPVSEYNRIMKACDVGIISLDHRFTIPNYPSRILGYMAMKKPVLACTDEITDIRSLVEKEGKFGLWCSSDDIDGFVNAVLKLSGDRALREEMGNKGYTYLKDNFNVQRSVDLIEKSL